MRCNFSRTSVLIGKILIVFVFICFFVGTFCVLRAAITSQEGTHTARLATVKDSPSNKVEEYNSLQNGYQSGDSLAAAVIILRSCGYNDVTIDSLIADGYVKCGNNNGIDGFCGNPAEANGYCFSPYLHTILSAYLNANDSDFRAIDIGGPFTFTKKYIKKNFPIAVWVTADMQTPKWVVESDSSYGYYSNMRTVVVYDIDEDFVYMFDPVDGKKTVDIATFQTVYESCGHQAITVS